MKLLNLLSAVSLVAPISLIACQSQNETFIAQEIANIPSCGLSCLEITIPRVGCGFLNMTCQCASQRLVKITSECMMANCTLAESVELDKIQAAICDRPYQSRNQLIRTMSIVCTIITYTAVAARLATRHCLHQYYRLDDWFIIGAACTDAVFTGLGIAFEHNGFGEHVWEIKVNMIPRLLYWFYLCEVFYVITISLIKMSILTFYLKIFPNIRIRCWVVMIFCLTGAFAFLIVTIFQCHPLSYAWNKNIHGGKCINFNSVTWANGAINIFQDLLIIALPIPEVRKLQLERKKKMGLYIMFGLGGFVCIASIVRLYTLKTFGLTADATWDNIPITVWTTLETTFAMLCTCLPTIRAGLLHFFPQAFGSMRTAATTSAKPAISYQNTFEIPAMPKSWPSRKLTSESSLSV